MTRVSESLAALKKRVDEAARKAGRSPDEVHIVLVTKTVSPEKIMEAYWSGHRLFGENRVQELEEKAGSLPKDIEWHLIGHLQTNKVKDAVRAARVIQSVDSIKVADEIHKRLSQADKKMKVMVQVNISKEATKYGVDPSQAGVLVKAVRSMPSLELSGLMGIGPLGAAEEVRKSFRLLREMRDRFEGEFSMKLPVLSMGMSQDFETAIEEGSTMVRVGTAVFGERHSDAA